MSRSDGPSTTPLPATSFKVVWFAPDRPVEGNTMYVRPSVESAPVTGPDSAVLPTDVDD